MQRLARKFVVSMVAAQAFGGPRGYSWVFGNNEYPRNTFHNPASNGESYGYPSGIRGYMTRIVRVRYPSRMHVYPEVLFDLRSYLMKDDDWQ